MLSNQFLNYAKVAKYLIGLVNLNSMISNQFLNYNDSNQTAKEFDKFIGTRSVSKIASPWGLPTKHDKH